MTAASRVPEKFRLAAGSNIVNPPLTRIRGSLTPIKLLNFRFRSRRVGQDHEIERQSQSAQGQRQKVGFPPTEPIPTGAANGKDGANLVIRRGGI
jgi:hypothetical protein